MSNVHYDSHSPYMSFNEDDLRTLDIFIEYWMKEHEEMSKSPIKYSMTFEYMEKAKALRKFINDGLDEMDKKHGR